MDLFDHNGDIENIAEARSNMERPAMSTLTTDDGLARRKSVRILILSTGACLLRGLEDLGASPSTRGERRHCEAADVVDDVG